MSSEGRGASNFLKNPFPQLKWAFFSCPTTKPFSVAPSLEPNSPRSLPRRLQRGPSARFRYDLDCRASNQRLQLYFRKNHYRINKYIARFGKNIIVTSYHDLSTDDIVRASLDRYQVENAFRQTKAGEFGNFRPMWHWTDSKIRCHIFSCIVALTYLRLATLWLNRAGVVCSPDNTMQSMRNLNSCLCWHSGKRKPARMLEEPDPEQTAPRCHWLQNTK